MSDKEPRRAKKKRAFDNVVAVLVQETSEDGSNMDLGEQFDERMLSLLSQSFTADTLVSALSAPEVSVRLFYGDDPGTVASVNVILEYLRKRFAKERGENFDIRFDAIELPADRWGVKMELAMKYCFDEGFKKVVFMGSRSPTVTVNLIQQAMQQLDECDAVFGPTVEGRYYLLGMSGKYHTALSNFDWTKPTIYSDVSNALSEQGLKWSELPMWYVVEHPEDVEYLVRDINQFRIEGDETTAFETERALSKMLSEIEE